MTKISQRKLESTVPPPRLAPLSKYIALASNPFSFSSSAARFVAVHTSTKSGKPSCPLPYALLNNRSLTLPVLYFSNCLFSPLSAPWPTNSTHLFLPPMASSVLSISASSPRRPVHPATRVNPGAVSPFPALRDRLLRKFYPILTHPPSFAYDTPSSSSSSSRSHPSQILNLRSTPPDLLWNLFSHACAQVWIIHHLLPLLPVLRRSHPFLVKSLPTGPLFPPPQLEQRVGPCDLRRLLLTKRGVYLAAWTRLLQSLTCSCTSRVGARCPVSLVRHLRPCSRVRVRPCPAKASRRRRYGEIYSVAQLIPTADFPHPGT